MYIKTDMSKNFSILSPKRGDFCRNKITMVPIEPVHNALAGDPDLFNFLNHCGNIFSSAADFAICPLKNIQAFSDPKHIKKVASPISLSNEPPNNSTITLANGAPVFSNSHGGITPNIEIVFMTLIIATNDVPQIIARGIVLFGFFTTPAGDAPPSSPTNPQNDKIVALMIVSSGCMSIGVISLKLSRLMCLNANIGIINRGRVLKHVKIMSSAPAVLTPLVLTMVNDSTMIISKASFVV